MPSFRWKKKAAGAVVDRKSTRLNSSDLGISFPIFCMETPRLFPYTTLFRSLGCGRPRFVFFNDTATTEIYTLSLHDALPICKDHECPIGKTRAGSDAGHRKPAARPGGDHPLAHPFNRSRKQRGTTDRSHGAPDRPNPPTPGLSLDRHRGLAGARTRAG